MPSVRANWHIRLTDGEIFLLERNVPIAPEAVPDPRADSRASNHSIIGLARTSSRIPA
jgi:hypothetical protein